MQISRQQKGLQEFLSWSCEDRLEEARESSKQPASNMSDKLSQPAVPVRVQSSHRLADFLSDKIQH